MDYIKAGLDAQAAVAGLIHCRTCGFQHEPSPDDCPRWAPEQPAERPAERPKVNALLTAMRAALADYDHYTGLSLAERAEQHRLPEFAGRFAELVRAELAERVILAAQIGDRLANERADRQVICEDTAESLWPSGSRFSASDFAQSRAAGDD